MTITSIFKEYFEISSTDNNNPDLKYVITRMPKHGDLFLKCKNMVILNLDGGKHVTVLKIVLSSINKTFIFYMTSSLV